MVEFFGPITPLVIIAVIAGIVENAKRVAAGEPLAWQYVLAGVLGVVVGGTWWFAVQVDAQRAISLLMVMESLIYGLALGWATSGTYDIIKRGK